MLEHHRVEALPQLAGRDVDADVDTGAEDRALLAHLVEPAVDLPLLHLELGDAEAQQAADLVGSLVDDDRVAGPRQLLGGRQAGGPGADHGDGLAGQPVDLLRPDAGWSPTPGRRWSTSTFLIVTGSWLIPSTQDVSHGAGQSRPVNSGKLFVACSRSIAPSQSSR